jgi:hypothetical protein
MRRQEAGRWHEIDRLQATTSRVNGDRTERTAPPQAASDRVPRVPGRGKKIVAARLSRNFFRGHRFIDR